MTNSKNFEISRRAFLGGGLASAIGLCLTSCSFNLSGENNSSLSAALSMVSPDLINNKELYPLVDCVDWHIFEPLYRIDTSTGEFVCCLAESEPKKISDLTYEIAIKNNKYFSNGDKVTSNDVITDFNYNFSKNVYSQLFDFIESTQVVNETTINLKLKEDLELNLLMSRLTLIRAFKLLGTDYDSLHNVVGSGPYVFKEGQSFDDGVIKFEPNPYYSGDYPPDKNGMIWYLIKDETKRMQALKDGKVNIVESADPTIKEDLKRKGYDEQILDTLFMALLSFNCKEPPFNDYRVRQAMLYAVDIDKVISSGFGGYAKKATSYLPEYHLNYHKASNVYSYDPKQAAELLADAKQNHFRVNIVSDEGPWQRVLAEQIQKDLSAVGLTARIRYTDDAWYDVFNGDNTDYHISLVSIDPSAIGADCDLLLNVLYGNNAITDKYTLWKHSINSRFFELQSLLKQARTSSSAQQQSIWNKCFDLISEEVPIYPLLHRQIATAWNPKAIQDFQPIPKEGLSLIGCTSK